MSCTATRITQLIKLDQRLIVVNKCPVEVGITFVITDWDGACGIVIRCEVCRCEVKLAVSRCRYFRHEDFGRWNESTITGLARITDGNCTSMSSEHGLERAKELLTRPRTRRDVEPWPNLDHRSPILWKPELGFVCSARSGEMLPDLPISACNILVVGRYKNDYKGLRGFSSVHWWYAVRETWRGLICIVVKWNWLCLDVAISDTKISVGGTNQHLGVFEYLVADNA